RRRHDDDGHAILLRLLQHRAKCVGNSGLFLCKRDWCNGKSRQQANRQCREYKTQHQMPPAPELRPERGKKASANTVQRPVSLDIFAPDQTRSSATAIPCPTPTHMV